MALTPDTSIRLIKSPLELDNKNQITFATKQAQETYFKSLPYLEIENCAYQRHDNYIRWPAHIDSLLTYNYVMYQNDNYSSKWFYAFITKMEYHNDGETYVYIQTDVFQTWQFDILWKQSFIDREMLSSNDDLIGANRIPEGLETGEYTIKKSYNITDMDFYYVIAYVGESFKITGGTNIGTPQRGYKYNGVYSSVCYILANDNGFSYLMSHLADEDNSNNVLTIFTIPKFSVNIPAGSTSWTNDGYYVVNENMYSLGKTLDNTFFDSLTDTFDFENYVPKNKKLLQYPYCYLGFNPIVGDNKIFRYEDFRNFTPKFVLESEMNPNPNVLCTPYNYRRENETHGGIQYEYKCYEETASIGGYPNVSYKTDVFNTWMAQHQDILKLTLEQETVGYQQQTANNILSLARNANYGDFSYGAINAANAGVNQAFATKNHELFAQMQLAQIEKQKMLPDKANLSSNATIAGYNFIGKNVFTTYIIRREFAEKIDKFFSMFGYKTNTVKIPNLNNRSNWNYVKTQGANILGDIPQNDLQTIKDMFDNGITLWHTTSYFLDYSQNNT